MELPFFTTSAGSSAATKAEAMRWLAIAEKLLAGRDLVGSKSFAARARESDPTLVYADQIIAVADTLIAGDKRINNQPDWYSILQLAGQQIHDSELIAGQYRKLVLLLNPQKNRLPYADQAFNLVMSAWSVLSNPSRKAMYDNELMAHMTVNAPATGFNPIFSGVSREQVNYHQPFEIFQLMPQQGMVTEQVNDMQQLHGLSREQVSLQLPPYCASREQVTRSMPQLNLSREQVRQPQPQPQPQPPRQPQPRLQQQPKHQQQPQQQPQPKPQQQRPAQPLQQPQPQPQPQPVQQRKEHLVGGNVRENFYVSVGGTNSQNNNDSDGAQNDGNLNRNVGSDEVREETGVNGSSVDEESSFWTACPYCYYMYQYPIVYADCIFRCQNKKCRKAFHGEVIPSPPPIVGGQEAYFCCWGMIPLGVSMSMLERNIGVGGNWTPFSPIFNCPNGAGNYGISGNGNFFGGCSANNNVLGSRGGYMGGRKISGPRVYMVDDDDGVLLGYSDLSEGSDDDWRVVERRIKMKGVKRKGTVESSKKVTRARVDNESNVNGVGSDTVSDEFVLQESIEIPNGSCTESSKEGAADSIKKGGAESSKKGVTESGKKGVTNNARRQSSRKAKDLGRLDLNVEFSNEAEEPVRRASQGNGTGRREEDIIEGSGFFEGLDEFLSSLPILNVVGDDKVKAT